MGKFYKVDATCLTIAVNGYKQKKEKRRLHKACLTALQIQWLTRGDVMEYTVRLSSKKEGTLERMKGRQRKKYDETIPP